MPATPLTFALGGIVLDAFEISGEFDLGHEALEVTHQYISTTGQPVVQVFNMGMFPLPTEWEGTLFYNTALSRAQELDQMATSQNPNYPIVWQYGPLEFNVFIKMFKYTVINNFEIRYKISLVVLNQTQQGGSSPNNQQQGGAQGAAQNNLQQGQAAYAQLTEFAALPAQVAQTYGQVITYAVQFSPLNSQTPADLQTLLGSVGALLEYLQTFFGPYQNDTTQLGGSILLAAMSAYNYFFLYQQNVLEFLNQGNSGMTVYQYVGNLFALASAEFPSNDVSTVAQAIATLNAIDDFWINTPTDILLPNLSTSVAA